jgi:hypothetical protein
MPLNNQRIPPNILSDYRAFDRWANNVHVSPDVGTVSPDKLSAATVTLINTAATTAASAARAAHEADPNPHPQYSLETNTVIAISSAQAAAIASSNATASAALAAFAALPDPFSQYLTQTEGDARYRELTDAVTYAEITGKPAALALIFSGTGTPEGAVTAGIGATFHRTDGGAGTSFYVKESGAGNTGWVAK